MATYQLTVDPDGRVTIPDTHPGEKITVQVTGVATEPELLTLATARTDDARAAVVEEIHRLARELRAQMGDDEQLSITHGDHLYDENGLPF